jgi:hypothetical protein
MKRRTLLKVVAASSGAALVPYIPNIKAIESVAAANQEPLYVASPVINGVLKVTTDKDILFFNLPVEEHIDELFNSTKYVVVKEFEHLEVIAEAEKVITVEKVEVKIDLFGFDNWIELSDQFGNKPIKVTLPKNASLHLQFHSTGILSYG